MFDDPLQVAAAVLAGVGGFFLGRLLASRLVGGCLGAAIGALVLVVVAYFLLYGEVELVGEATRNLSYYISVERGAFLAFVLGLFVGVGTRRRRR